MSEIKGQLLGIVLVVAIFGAVAGVLLGAFKTAAANTAEKITTEPTIQEEEDTPEAKQFNSSFDLLHF